MKLFYNLNFIKKIKETKRNFTSYAENYQTPTLKINKLFNKYFFFYILKR